MAEQWLTDVYSQNDIYLESHWRSEVQDGSYVWMEAPSEGVLTVDFPYSYISGTLFKEAHLCCDILETPESGISYFKVNGASGGLSNRLPVTLRDTNGTVTVEFAFRANGSKQDGDYHSAVLTVTNIRLEIVYRPIDLVAASSLTDDLAAMTSTPVPPQSVCILNQSNSEYYTFDGVTKVKHSLASRFDDDPDSDRDQYVNGARNEPDKIGLEVMMSDVYTDSTYLTNGVTLSSGETNARKRASFLKEGDPSSRSSKAAEKLYSLKTSRQKLTIVTPQHIYLDMVLGSVIINQDADSPFGWVGQLDFQHYLEMKPEKSTSSGSSSSGSSVKSSKKKSTGTTRPTSPLYQKKGTIVSSDNYVKYASVTRLSTGKTTYYYKKV